MSNSLSIATVTEAFRSLLDESAAASGVSGAIATKVRPTPLTNMGQPGGLPTSGVNVYLYQVAPNPAFRNSDLPTRRSDGSLMRPSRSAYDLSYLLTFYGDENRFEPQMVLGNVLRVMHSDPILTRDRLQTAALALNKLYKPLMPDVVIEIEQIKALLMPLGLEELSKLWSVFFQIPYSLSLAYQVSVVFIDGGEQAEPALPVAARNLYVQTFRNPVIEAVLSEKGASLPILTGQPILKGDLLVLAGERLKGDLNLVRLDDLEVPPLDVSDAQVRVLLDEPPFPADSLRAGAHAVQVVQGLPMGTPETAHDGFESNAEAFILRPSITAKVTPVATSVVKGVTWYDTDLTVTVSPKVGLDQHVLLLLNEYNPPSDRPAYAYQYDLTQTPIPPGPPLSSLGVHVHISTPAEYLVRLQVDGAESVLGLGPDPLHPLYSTPRVKIA